MSNMKICYPLIITGEGNLIEEQSEIINRQTVDESGAVPVMIIGNNNVFEVIMHS